MPEGDKGQYSCQCHARWPLTRMCPWPPEYSVLSRANYRVCSTFSVANVLSLWHLILEINVLLMSRFTINVSLRGNVRQTPSYAEFFIMCHVVLFWSSIAVCDSWWCPVLETFNSNLLHGIIGRSFEICCPTMISHSYVIEEELLSKFVIIYRLCGNAMG